MDEGVLEAARSVRPYLPGLLGSELADAVDAEIADLLAGEACGADAEAGLRSVLDSHEGTSVFLERVLWDAPRFRPPQVVADSTRSFRALPGDSSPVPADKFRCPRGDYVWYRIAVGVPIPVCRTHRCALEPA